MQMEHLTYIYILKIYAIRKHITYIKKKFPKLIYENICRWKIYFSSFVEFNGKRDDRYDDNTSSKYFIAIWVPHSHTKYLEHVEGVEHLKHSQLLYRACWLQKQKNNNSVKFELK